MQSKIGILILLGVCLSGVLGLREEFAAHLWHKFKQTHGKIFVEWHIQLRL